MGERRVIGDDEVVGQLEAYGRTWRDYFLFGDPPSVCSGGAEGLFALIIEDEDVAEATISFLIAREARRFNDIEAFRLATGWDGHWKPTE